MSDKLRKFDDPEAIAGVIRKTASVAPLEVTEKELEKINQYSLVPLKAEDVFTFKATMCDNEQDDRNYMPFDSKALEDLKDLYPGKTVLKDHAHMADNQIGRIYDTALVKDASRTTALGEPHTELTAKIYMVKTTSNADLIAEIQGGIKKEVSTSCTPEKMVCSICGTDNMKKWCKHYPGYDYMVKDEDGVSAPKTCTMLLSGAKDAYELSLVAVPAQPRAGATKSVGFTKPCEKPEEIAPEKTTTESDERLSNLRLTMLEREYHA